MNDALNNAERQTDYQRLQNQGTTIRLCSPSKQVELECVEKSKSKVRSRVTELIVLTPCPLTPALSTCSSFCLKHLTECNMRFPCENYGTYTDKCSPAVFRSIWYHDGDGERTSPGGGHVIPSTFHSTNNRHRCFTFANLGFRYHKYYVTFFIISPRHCRIVGLDN